MASPRIFKLSAAAANATAVCASQTPTAGNMLINGSAAVGGVAALDVARRVLITAAGNESANTFTVYGADRRGNPASEAVAGPNASTATTLQDYLTVTRVAVASNAAGAVTVGTSGTVSTEWNKVSFLTNPVNIGWTVNVLGTATYQIETTLDRTDKALYDLENGGSPLASTWTPPIPSVLVASSSASAIGSTTVPYRAIRLTLTAGGAAPGLVFTVEQGGIFG